MPGGLGENWFFFCEVWFVDVNKNIKKYAGISTYLNMEHGTWIDSLDIIM